MRVRAHFDRIERETFKEIEPDTECQLVEKLNKLNAIEGLNWLATQYPNEVVMSTAFGKEGQILTHILAEEQIPIELFTIDTGRLFQETQELHKKTEAKYGTLIKVFKPNQSLVNELVKTKGCYSFYESLSNRKECCDIRKLKPLKFALAGKKVWVSGVRAGHSHNRKSFQKLEYSARFGIWKYYPLLDWTEEEVETFLKKHQIPQNDLHQNGYASIGCEPCTRPIRKGEDARAGRWWWEKSTHKECGLHDTN